MRSLTQLPGRYLLPLVLFCVSHLSAQQISWTPLGFEAIAIPNFYRAAEAALLLNSQQLDELNTAWLPIAASLSAIQKRGANASQAEREKIKIAVMSFADKRNAIITSEQQDARILINDIVASVKKRLQLEYDQKRDIATSSTEKLALQKEQIEVLKNDCLEELKSSLSTERWSAFKKSFEEGQPATP